MGEGREEGFKDLKKEKTNLLYRAYLTSMQTS